MLVEIGVILLLVLANGIFAGTEMAIVSARGGRLQHLADQGNQGAAAALNLRDEPTRFLSTIQVGITLIATLTGVFGGASTAATLNAALEPLPVVGPYAEMLSLVLVVAGITYLSLVIGELVPKRIALQSSEAIAAQMAPWMRRLAVLNRPIIALLSFSTEGVLMLLGRRQHVETTVTEEDIRQLVREGAQEGSVEPQEEQIIEGVFKLSERTVRQVMTPRVDMEVLDGDAAVGDVLGDVIELGYSRYPVYREQPDEIVGIVHVRDMLEVYHTRDATALVRDAMSPPTLVPEATRASLLLTTFRKNQRHMASVVSELGSVEGLVTLEDVLEEIVGDILDENDEVEAQAITVRDDGSLLIDGGLPIDMLKQRLDVDELPDEAFHQYDTLAGFVLSLMGRIPQPGESLTWNDWRFEIMDMDGLRIDKVLVQQEEQPAEEPEQPLQP
jgi:putative hemolysin